MKPSRYSGVTDLPYSVGSSVDLMLCCNHWMILFQSCSYTALFNTGINPHNALSRCSRLAIEAQRGERVLHETVISPEPKVHRTKNGAIATRSSFL